MQALSPVQVTHHVTMLTTLFMIADETAQVTHELVKLIQKTPLGGKQIHDANIVATMLVYEINTLLTTNLADMKRFEPQIKISALVI